jgi:hypothetical protein
LKGGNSSNLVPFIKEKKQKKKEILLLATAWME